MATIDFEQARNSVQQNLAELEAEAARIADRHRNLTPREREVLGLGSTDGSLALALMDEETISGDFGWVFFYQSKAYLESGNLSDMLLGNAPIIVSRLDGTLHQTGTEHSVEVYIANFGRTGNPHEEA